MDGINLRSLKENIEKMSAHHQVEVLRILHNRPKVPLNENQNGTFVNLSQLDKATIQALQEYTEYVKDQTATLAVIEARKQQIQQKYFPKDNKDINIIHTEECHASANK